MADNNASNNEGTHVPGEVSPMMEEALSQGWVPKEEFQGDGDKWVDYPEFVRRGELFRKIESQSKEMKELKRAMNELAKHNTKIREIEYQRAIDQLKVEKKSALAEGDGDKVVEIDERLGLVKDQQKALLAQQVQQASEPTAVHPELRAWMDKNSWYESNRSMRGWADARGVELAEEGRSPTEVLRTLEQEVKDRFKEKFTNPNRNRPNAVESPRSAGRNTEADVELNDVEKTIMKTLVDGGHITKEEYLKQLKAVKAK